MAQNEIGQFDEVDNNNTDISGTTIVQGQMYPYMVDNAFRNLAGMLKRWFKTSLFRLRDSTDQTKLVAFDLSGLPTATTRTWTAPYYSGTLTLLSEIRGAIFGMALANDAGDLTNDIRIASGVTIDTSGASSLVLANSIIKRTDATWAVGTNQGGLDTGVVGNNTYHVFAIRRPDTGVVDVLFSLSATAPTLPANYTQFRRIGSILRELGTVIPFYQNGDVFMRSVSITDRNNTAAAAAALFALSVPAGIVVAPILRFRVDVGVSVLADISVGSAAQGGVTATILTIGTGAGDSADIQVVTPPPVFFTNASRQIYFAQTNTTGTPTTSNMVTLGWIDRRGQDGLA